IVSLIEEKSRLKNLIKEQKSKLKEKEKFLKEKEERELRAEDLKLMRSLFTGNGFVNFISTVRLQEVVNYANSRFMKLTRGKMKLELNDDNSFSVIDFLNDGKTRSIKSLSGGQTFQASLSLALALASIVQQQNKSNQNFFFLDEGFGTQDEESLRLVFDTIKSLRKENRIVGLISHVNQLKEEVNTYLDVVHDQNTGSYIVKSWE
ncbi:MAG TPA: SMC family ATPase, partial [Bacteroidetes bacterium]|nr:SMC family ATPase [Bacteroidota bacterium]